MTDHLTPKKQEQSKVPLYKAICRVGIALGAEYGDKHFVASEPIGHFADELLLMIDACNSHAARIAELEQMFAVAKSDFEIQQKRIEELEKERDGLKVQLATEIQVRNENFVEIGRLRVALSSMIADHESAGCHDCELLRSAKAALTDSKGGET
jgi:hypothetical protein